MRKYIYGLLCKTHGGVSNILFNVIQFIAQYNPYSDKFEVPLSQLQTSYFDDNPDSTEGIIENSPIHWEVTSEKLTFWLE